MVADPIHTLTPRTAPAGAPDRDQAVPVASLTYTVAQVAHLLALSRGGVYRMVRAGTIPAKRLGRRWVIPRQAFHEWLESCEVTPPRSASRSTTR